MKTEQGKYTIYSNNSNTVITVLNNENDHFIAAAIKSGLITFYSDTTIGDFCESIKTDTTSRIAFDGNFIVKSDSDNYEITYSFANHSKNYDRMMDEFNGYNEINKKNNKISIADYECKMSPQKILYTKNSDVYLYGMLDFLIQKENDQYYLVANLERCKYHTKDEQSFNERVIISSDLVNKLRPVFAFPSASVTTEGDNGMIIEIRIFKREWIDKSIPSKYTENAVCINSISDKVKNNYVEIKLDYIPVRIYY